MTARIREDLESIPPYVPGRTVAGAIKLASNETTMGPLPTVTKAIMETVEDANRYPDNGSVELIRALADTLGVEPENIATGCGSVAICGELVSITCVPGDEVLYAWRAFEAYPVVTKVAGATEVTVPLDAHHTHDLDAILAAITPRTRLIFVCNPNNPTGTAVGRRALERFLDAVPADVLVVIDEAYVEYVRIDPADRADGVELGRGRANVVVLRTFSKAYGLAGLRVGYAVADPAIVAALGKVRVPFSVSRVAQAAAVASLAAREELLDRTDSVVGERHRVRSALIDAGYRVAESETNFLWLPLGDRATAFAAMLAESNVIVRAFAGDGVRITVGAPHENDRLLELATEADSSSSFTG